MKPNAFFMLEASYTSQFIGIALIIELGFFRRWRWLSVFGLALIGTFSGTGLMLVLLALPVLAVRFWRQMLLYGLILLPLLGGVAVATGWYEITSKRVSTFGDDRTSASGRFIVPFTSMVDLLVSGDERAVIYGFGAGKTSVQEIVPGLEPVEYNAVSKSLIEYGFFATVLFLVFSTYFLFWTGAPFIVAYAAALEYHLMGGHLLLPPILNYCYVLTAGWALGDPPATRSRSCVGHPK